MDNTKAIFTTHVDNRGRLKDGKERFECQFCRGEAYISDSFVTPTGRQHYTYICTDCADGWHESY